MTHVSKQKLEERVLIKIYSELTELISYQKSGKKRSEFLNEILTETEKIMLAKRLAIILMLSRGASTYQIGETLKISPSTAERFSNAIEMGRYKQIIDSFTNSKSKKIEKIIEGIFKGLFALARPVHAPRWKWLDDIYK